MREPTKNLIILENGDMNHDKPRGNGNLHVNGAYVIKSLFFYTNKF